MPLPRSVKLIKFIATFFYVGFLRPAPGTWGSLAGIISAYIFFQLTSFLVFCFLLIFSVLIGFWTTKKYIEQNPENSDPSEVVIDEVIGQWIAILPIGYIFQLEHTNTENLWIFWLWAFVSFRFFDIVKLGLVGWADKLGGALGVILDDILAGVAAAITLTALLILT